jgi:hypothetical protein
MKLLRRTFLRVAAGAAALPVASRVAQAQTYPTRPIRPGIALRKAAAFARWHEPEHALLRQSR